MNTTFTELCYAGCKPYKPKINRKRQGILGSLVLADLILPMTFGIGVVMTKLITKFFPLYMYQ